MYKSPDILESLGELCFYPRSVVKNKPPRKALAGNMGPFMPACFSLIFISFISIYISVFHLRYIMPVTALEAMKQAPRVCL